MADAKLSALTQQSVPALADFTYIIDGTPTSQKQSWTRALGLLTFPVSGRLTTESGVAISASDRTAQGTLYYTPYIGQLIALYDGTRWRLYSTAEVSLALTVTSGNNYDVFLYDNAGTVTLELSAAWSTDILRTNVLTTQDGVIVKSAASTRRWIGTIRASGANVTADSSAARFVYNAYNQVIRRGYLDTQASHTYNSGTVRAWNNDTANRLEVVLGAAATVPLTLGAQVEPAVGVGAFPIVRLVLDWTSGAGAAAYDEVFWGLQTNAAGGVTNYLGHHAVMRTIPLGYHYLQLTEDEGAAATSTFSQAQANALWLL